MPGDVAYQFATHASSTKVLDRLTAFYKKAKEIAQEPHAKFG